MGIFLSPVDASPRPDAWLGMRILPALILLACPVWAAPPAEAPSASPAAPEKEKPAAAPGQEAKAEAPKTPDKPVANLKTTSAGKVTLGGKEIPYEAETNTLVLLNEKDEPTARVFYVYYHRTDVETPEGRPLLFCFNGGPGSSATWLHLGGLGPRRVVMGEDGTNSPPPPFGLEPNPHSPLDASDLVFVDPVGTGFSRAEQGKDQRQFAGFQEDVGYLSDFIRRFVGEHGRWKSPKYLLGESYGALRVAGLADQLQNRFGMYLNGVVLMSGLLDFRTLSSSGGNDLPYICYVPVYASIARYHHRRPETLEAGQAMSEARALAFGDYATALLQGNQLTDERRTALIGRLEKATTIPAEVWRRANLRVEPEVFRQWLLRDSGQAIGRFDARVKAPATDKLGNFAEGDPSFDVAWGAFSTSINDYLGRELKVSGPQVYEVLKGAAWDYGSSNSFASADDRLVSALRRNPRLKVLVQCGFYDLATPPDGILHSLSQLDLPDSLRANLSVEFYEGGHMFYLNRAASAKLRTDLLKFLSP